MGYYVNEDSTGKHIGTSFEEKVKALLNDGGVQVNGEKFEPNLICVVDNGIFAAAGYAYSEQEYQVFKNPDGRNKTWIVHPKAKELAK